MIAYVFEARDIVKFPKHDIMCFKNFIVGTPTRLCHIHVDAKYKNCKLSMDGTNALINETNFPQQSFKCCIAGYSDFKGTPVVLLLILSLVGL